MVQELNDVSFEAAIAASPYALVDFYAPWCSPCKALAPLLTRLAVTVQDLDVFKVDIDSVTVVATWFQVIGVPLLVLMKKGTVIATKTGAPTFSTLVAWVEAHRAV